MQEKLAEYNKSFFNPFRLGGDVNLAARVAQDKWGGFWGPFLP